MKSKLLEKLLEKIRGKYWREEFLLAKLADRNADKRHEAAIRLEQMEYEEFSELIVAVTYQLRLLRKRALPLSWIAYPLLYGWALFAVWLRLLGYVNHIIIPLLFPLSVVIFISFRATTDRLAVLKEGLAQIDDLRVIGLLAEASSDVGDQDIEEALIRMLPRLRASDANLLTSSQRLKLCMMLAHVGLPLSEHDTNLRIAILKAFEQVGDDEAIPYVQSLIDVAKHLPAGVHEAAEACLPFLLTRAEQTKAGHGLLRAAQAPTGELLRPSQNADSSSPQMLLRAVKSKDEG